MKLKIIRIILPCAFILLGCSKSSVDEKEPQITLPEPEPQPVVNEAPSIPLHVYPDNDLVCLESEINFAWESSSDPENDPVSYVLEISQQDDFSDISAEAATAELSKTISLEKGKTYYWRVMAQDDNGNQSDFSSVFVFYTEPDPVVNHVPSMPELVKPVLNSVLEETLVQLSWSATDQDGDALEYDLYFGTDPEPPILNNSIVNPEFEINVTPGNTYYWKIVVKDGKGGIAIGPVWSFGTK